MTLEPISYPDFITDLPPTLYKYLSFSAALPGRPTDLLLRNLIWFASPLTFNDPFDCIPRIDLTGTSAELKSFYLRMLKYQKVAVSRTDRRLTLAKINRSRGGTRLKLRISQVQGIETWRETVARIGVLSLTSKPDDLLMWGHYAAAHTGFCLRFDPTKDPFAMAYRVIYQDERPTYRLLDAHRAELISDVLTRKAEPWRYEREWRALKAGVTGNFQFDPSSLTGLIFGAAIKPDDEAFVRGILARRAQPVELFRSEIDQDSFRVRIVPAG